jgi:hypothetical protein
VELAAAFGTSQSGGLILAAIAAVFTIGYVANMLGEDEDWLHKLSISMFPEDGCLHVYGVGDDGDSISKRRILLEGRPDPLGPYRRPPNVSLGRGTTARRRSRPRNRQPSKHRRPQQAGQLMPAVLTGARVRQYLATDRGHNERVVQLAIGQ